MKTCTVCKRSLSLKEFHRQASSGDGHQSTCSECAKRKAREYYHENKHKRHPRSTEPKRCPECGIIKPAADYSSRSYSHDGLCAKCWSCDSSKRLEHFKNHREKYYRRSREYGRQNRHQTRAQVKVSRAIKKGDLARPSQCSKCGRTARIEARHPDYSQPLQVEWLCRRCHLKLQVVEQRTNDEKE